MKAGSFFAKLALFLLALIVFLLLLYIFVFPPAASAPSVKISSLLPAVWLPEKENRKAALIREVSIGGKTIFAEVAASEEERAVGLSGRNSLPENRGMLFIFPEKRTPVFWMRDVSFPLDIIWIEDGIVVGLSGNILPEPGVFVENLKRYASPGEVDMVLEVNGGFIDKNKISVGAEVVVK